MKPIRLGMIGGGPGSFIGGVHRMAARLDGRYDLVAGAFSSDPARSRQTGEELGLDPARTYANYAGMLDAEAALPQDIRMQAVSIVTPNHLHLDPALRALEAGFDVILDKPMTFSLDEARRLKEAVEHTGRGLCVTYTYSAYPMLREARSRIADGTLGAVRKVYVEYPQGWLSRPQEKAGHAGAEWRTDPARSGAAGAMGDIGTHAFHLLEYVTGLLVTELCADLNVVVPGRRLDDDGAMLLRLSNGATAVLMATQIAAGEENNLKIRVYGELGGLCWQQGDNNSLELLWPDRPKETLRTGSDYLSPAARAAARVPAGHPEGYLEAFANLYANFARHLTGDGYDPALHDYPTVDDGLRGMAFIEAAVRSSSSSQKWTALTV